MNECHALRMTLTEKALCDPAGSAKPVPEGTTSPENGAVQGCKYWGWKRCNQCTVQALEWVYPWVVTRDVRHPTSKRVLLYRVHNSLSMVFIESSRYRGDHRRSAHWRRAKPVRGERRGYAVQHTLRQRLAYLGRSALSFAKQLAHPVGALTLCICHDNLTRVAMESAHDLGITPLPSIVGYWAMRYTRAAVSWNMAARSAAE